LEKHCAPNRAGPLLSAAQLYFQIGPRPHRRELAWTTRSLACTCAPGRRSDRAPTPTPSTTSRPRQLLLRRVPPASRPPCVVHVVAIPCADTSHRRCQLAATSAPHVTHAAATPCVTPSRYWSVGEAVSPLPVTAAKRRPLRSALTTLLCSLVAALLCSKR
jgi:hypothetical protein